MRPQRESKAPKKVAARQKYGMRFTFTVSPLYVGCTEPGSADYVTPFRPFNVFDSDRAGVTKLSSSMQFNLVGRSRSQGFRQYSRLSTAI
jgi:hypothetical protein